jgi:hypothetical protein
MPTWDGHPQSTEFNTPLNSTTATRTPASTLLDAFRNTLEADQDSFRTIPATSTRGFNFE